MRIAIYEGSNHAFYPTCVGMLYKYGTLIADSILCGGNTVDKHDFIKYAPQLPLEKRIKILIQVREGKEEEINEMEDVLVIIKSYNKIKHKTSEELRNFLTLNKLFNKCFEEEVINEEKDMLKRDGLPSFDGPLSNTGLFKPYIIHSINNELGSAPYTPFSEILKGISNVNSPTKDITLLPFEFLHSDWGLHSSSIYKIDQEEALDANNCWFHTCLQLPNAYAISESEILLIRSQVENHSSIFRQRIDEWLEIFTNSNELANRITFLEEKVMPTATLLQHAFNENVIIQKPSNIEFEHFNIDILIGEVPIKMFFDFFYRSGSLQEETWNVIKQWLQEDDKINIRLPVFTIDYSAEFKENREKRKEKNENDEVMQHTKKYIAID